MASIQDLKGDYHDTKARLQACSLPPGQPAFHDGTRALLLNAMNAADFQARDALRDAWDFRRRDDIPPRQGDKAIRHAIRTMKAFQERADLYIRFVDDRADRRNRTAEFETWMDTL